MKYRKLRLQLLVVCAVSCVLLALVSLHGFRTSSAETRFVKPDFAWRLYASLSLLSGLVAVFIALGSRFSLRTLFVVMTIVALALGLIFHTARG
jgi:hypothetical protein